MNDTWIGLVHVAPEKGNDLLEGAIGAYVSALAIANNTDDYQKKVSSFFKDLDFMVLDFEDIELFKNRKKEGNVEADICDLEKELNMDNPVVLSVFDAYESE